MTFNVKTNVDKDALWATIPAEKPVLFWDTCGLLDCLRILKRFDKTYYDNYLHLLNLIIKGEVISVIPQLVLFELKLNWDTVHKEAERFQCDIQEGASNMIHIHTDNKSEADRIKNELIKADVLKITIDLLNNILANSYVVNEHQAFQDFAHFRLVNKLAPAHKKNEYKDCYIWGCTNICANIRPDKSRKVLFISSNIEDYTMLDSKKKLEDRIIEDCNINKIIFTKNIGELRGVLGKI